MSFQPYPEYKDSGVESLGKVPTEWDVVSVSRFVTFGNGADYKHVEVAEGGYPVIGSGGEFRRASEYLFDGESVLFGRKGTVDKPLYVTGKFWTVDTMYYTDIDSRHLVPKFLYYWALRIPFDFYLTNTALPSMTQTDLGSAKIALPDPVVQKEIVQFLDRETAEIDAFIADQERLIELLNERRAATITHAVTKGLDPNAPMRDSGIKGLGDIPEHWISGPVKRFFVSLDSKRIPLSSEERSYRQGPFPYYGASGIIDMIDDFLFDEPLVLVSEDGANLNLRSTPIAFVARGKYWVNNHAHILRPRNEAVYFWAERLEALDVSPWTTGAAQPKLTAEALMNLEIAVPPSLEESLNIQEHILQETNEIDAAVGDAREAIALSRERRVALISAAVTGQVDVSQAQSRESVGEMLEEEVRV